MAKVVITAAGKGTRILPFTKEMPKEMRPIFSKISANNRTVLPLLQYVYEQVGTVESYKNAQEITFRKT